jgi:hypothetical protein
MSDNYHYEDGANHYDHKRVLHIDKVQGADLQQLVRAFFKDDAEEAEVVDEIKEADEIGDDLLVNNIFRDDIFTSNDLLVKLRQTIANAVGQGDADRIDLTHANEWYWLYAGLLDAGFLETRSNRENAVTDIGFVRQMALWFPDLLDVNDRKKIRQICNGLSAERTKWTMNGKLISLVDIEANKRRLTAMKETKVSRIVSVAYQGLYVPLAALKQEIERENNTEFKKQS